MAEIIKSFVYEMPDDYLYQTNTLGKTASWTYRGPDKIWVFVDKETNKLALNNYLTKEEDGDVYPTPPEYIKVEIDAEQDPLMATLIGASERVDYATLPQYSETMPDGTVYERPLNPAPDHTYETFEIEYDPSTGYFKRPFPWKKPHVTWDDIRRVRNGALDYADPRINDDTPPALKKQWEDYKQFLRDLPQLYEGKDPWKVSFPRNPMGD